MRKTITFIIALAFSFCAYSAEYEITPYNEHNPEIIGKYYRFQVPMTYLVLTDSPPHFLKGNNNIERMLSTVELAAGNDLHIKEAIDENMIYEVVSIFYVKDLTPPPEDWPYEEKQAYLQWLTQVQEAINIHIELRDENGVFSSVSAHLFEQSYDVTDDRNRIVRPYTYDVTPGVREQVINYGKRMGDQIPEDEAHFQYYVNTVVSPQIMLEFQMTISKQCDVEIKAQCQDIYNVHEIIRCLGCEYRTAHLKLSK